MFRFGFGNVGIFDKRYERSMLQIDGEIVLHGKVFIGHGSRLCVGQNGILEFRNNFMNSAKTTIVCQKKMSFGNNIVISWNTLIMDTDWHPIKDTKTEEIYFGAVEKPVIIGDGVWIGARGVILKGTEIAKGCIVAANSTCCNKKYREPECLLAGNPATVHKSNVVLYREEKENELYKQV